MKSGFASVYFLAKLLETSARKRLSIEGIECTNITLKMPHYLNTKIREKKQAYTFESILSILFPIFFISEE